jgi:ParB family transcriptional regulator, chromosome partitioning protein
MYRRNVEWFSRDRSATAATTATTQDVDTDTTSEAEREAARLRAEAERAEAEKRERRKVIALNRLGAAAITVRREFVTTLVARLVDCTNAFPS